jgi:hypothetical protein
MPNTAPFAVLATQGISIAPPPGGWAPSMRTWNANGSFPMLEVVNSTKDGPALTPNRPRRSWAASWTTTCEFLICASHSWRPR